MLLSTVIYYIHPANYTIETVYFVQLAVLVKLTYFSFGLLLSRLRSHSWNGYSLLSNRPKWKLRKIQFHCGALMWTLPLFAGLTNTSFFACGQNEVSCKRSIFPKSSPNPNECIHERSKRVQTLIHNTQRFQEKQTAYRLLNNIPSINFDDHMVILLSSKFLYVSLVRGVFKKFGEINTKATVQVPAGMLGYCTTVRPSSTSSYAAKCSNNNNNN